MKLLLGGLFGLVLVIASTGASDADQPEWMQLAQTNVDASFAAFVRRFGKSYLNPLEYSKRRDIYRDNLLKIEQNNAAGNGNQMRANEFADLTADEFVATMTGLLPVQPRDQNSAAPFRYADAEAPNSMDWRQQGAVAPVKNQGACGSCWAFSAVGAIEGVNAIVTGDLVTLSEQQLVDCDRKEDQGCSGGLMDNAFDYVEANGGLDTEANYAYWGAMGILGCSANREHRTVVSIDGHEDVPADDEAALKKAAAHQPVSVAICVNGALQFYAGGVFDKECCTQLNHGVLVVGYDDAPADGAEPYWLVKNSWGASWGEGGFFRLRQGVGEHGQCGLAMSPSYPIKTHGNEPTIDVCGWLGWQTCDVGSACHCTFNLFNLEWLCLSFECVPHGGDAQQGEQPEQPVTEE